MTPSSDVCVCVCDGFNRRLDISRRLPHKPDHESGEQGNTNGFMPAIASGANQTENDRTAIDETKLI